MPLIRRSERATPRDPLTPQQRKDAAAVGLRRPGVLDASWRMGAVTWKALRREMRILLRTRARERGRYTYAELAADADRRGHPYLDPHGEEMADMLRQLDLLELQQGLPMISAIVVQEHGESRPGRGFANLARDLGLDVADDETSVLAFWLSEMGECHRAWAYRDVMAGLH
jgi:hypothetical protein